MSNIVNMSVHTNEDLIRDFALKADSKDVPYDLTNAVLRMRVIDDRGKEVAMLHNGSSGRAYLFIPDPEMGIVGIRLDRVAFAKRAEQVLRYDILLVTNNSNERRLWGGEITVLEGITF